MLKYDTKVICLIIERPIVLEFQANYIDVYKLSIYNFAAYLSRWLCNVIKHVSKNYTYS